MGLNQNRTQPLWLHQARKQRLADRATPDFEAEAIVLKGALQPLEEKEAAEAYGEESARRALLLTEDRRVLKEGTGVALEAEGECVFRIAAPPERWSTHQRAILKSI